MASFVFTEAKRAILAGDLDFDAADMRVLMVMTNTTANTQEDVTTIGAITTLDELNGTGYSAGGAALAGESVAANNGSNLGFFDAVDLTFTAIGAGTRSIQAAILYKFVTSVSLSMPVAYIDTGGFPFAANGGDIVFTWNAGGILQAT